MSGSQKIIVTGALGSVGVWVVQRLLDEGHHVVAITRRRDFSHRPALHGAIPVHLLDIRDTEGLSQLFQRERPDAICHTAAKVIGPQIEADKDPYSTLAVNAMGTVSILEAARRSGVGRVAFASSRGVYGLIRGRYGYPMYHPVKESRRRQARPEQRGYIAAKIFSEEIGRYYAAKFDLSFRALYFGTIVRPVKAEIDNSFAALYPAMVLSALEGKQFNRHVILDARDDLTYVKDVAHGLALASTIESAPSWCFNIGTGVASTTTDFANALIRVIPDADIQLFPKAADSNFRALAILDIARSSRELGYSPEFGLQAMVDDLVLEMRELI